MPKLIVVTGITGAQGGSVANTFLKEPEWKVRGLTRDPSSDKAKTWISRGVEMVKAEFEDAASLKSAFQGATVVFAVTDFWAICWNPATQQKLKPGQELNQYAHDVEVQQGKNMVDAAASVRGLERFIFSGLASPAAAGANYKNLYHIESKPKITEYIKNHHPDLNKKTSEVQLSFYFENWRLGLSTVPRKGPDGKYHNGCMGPGKTSMVMTGAIHDTGPCVRALVDYKPGVTLSLNSDAVSWTEMLRVFCETQKVPFGGYDELTEEQFLEKFPGPRALGVELGENCTWLEDMTEYMNAGKMKTLRPKDLGVKTQTWREYCEVTNFSSILS